MVSLKQLADARDVMEAVKSLEGSRLPVLTPNLKVGIFVTGTLQAI